MTMLNTLLLDRAAWDLVLDSRGDIAMAQPPYAVSQDVASAVKLFSGELWYNTNQGVPYFEEILGKLPPIPLLTGYMERAALTVPGVVTAQCVISAFDQREISGQIQFIDETGAANAANF